MNATTIAVEEVDAFGESCDACAAEPDKLYMSGDACATLLCAACLEQSKNEGAARQRARRCSFCGAINPKLDLSGSPICSPACSGKELLRRAHATYPRVIEVLEVDGARVVDQMAWASEWRRPEGAADYAGTLHIHGQQIWHDEAYVVGDMDGLRALRDAIDRCLAGGVGSVDVARTFATDGEGYRAVVICGDMADAMLPYSSDSAASESGIAPHERISEEQYDKLWP